MILEVKSYNSGDVDDLKNWVAPSVEEIYFQLEIEVGERGVEGGHFFQLLVASPQGLKKYHVGEALKAYNSLNSAGARNKGILFLNSYSWSNLVAAIDVILKNCSADSWSESIDLLRKYFFWEYEGLNKY